SKAKIIVALDSDFLCPHPYALRYARDFANARRVIEPDQAQMNRFYAAEPTPTITGSNADHRVAVAARDILPLARAIAAQLGVTELDGLKPSSLTKLENQDWIRAVVGDLKANRGQSIVIAGETQPQEVHLLVAQINDALGNIGILPAPQIAFPPNRIPLHELVDEMQRGLVELVIVLGGNPLYDAPVDLNFRAVFEKVKFRIHHSVQFNETSRQSHWHVPATHFLESWSDTCAFDGTVSIVQPLIEPMYAGVSAHEILEALLGQAPRTPYDIVRSSWESSNRGPAFETKWRQALSDGVVREQSPPTFDFAAAGQVPERPISNPQPPITNLEVLFRPDVSLRDGRYANNGWLQELPRQFSKLVWDNAA